MKEGGLLQKEAFEKTALFSVIRDAVMTNFPAAREQRGTLGPILTEDEGGVLRDVRAYSTFRDGLRKKCGFPSGKRALRRVRRVDPSAREVNLMDNPSTPGS
ncbi:hypothetical protein QQF64_029669 [Cirrhinus molitorella]|uniref:Uncharacterized protein n=1 Tax=Cirrhinus molitorella TaxID=172907 RepID=A0ABR3N1C5_9TELE